MHQTYREFLLRDWQPNDRHAAATVVQQALEEYGLPWQPETVDRTVIEPEIYQQAGGEFWVVEQAGQIVGTAAYYPLGETVPHAVELCKMYLQSSVRGQGVGQWLLVQLEQAIAEQGFREIRIETASVLTQAIVLYERNGYQRMDHPLTVARCDRAYVKHVSGPCQA